MTKGKTGKNRQKSGAKSKDEVERKRDERARRNALRKEREAKEYLENDENFLSFSNQLQALGYKIKDIKGDGNCLFRALADQLDGSDDGHLRYRRIIVKYLADHREAFEPFVEDNKSFEEHVQELSKAGTYGGHDSIVAFSRYYGVNVVIHQLNERCWVIEGDKYRKADEPSKELHISYHNGDHYSSVRRISDPDDGPAWMFNKKHKVSSSEDSPQIQDKGSSRKAKAKKADVYNQAIASRKSSDIAIIQAATGCQDMELIQQSLLESDHDLDSTISYILQLQSFSANEDFGPVVEDNDAVMTSNFSNVLDDDVKLSCQEGKESASSTFNIPPDQKFMENMAKGGAIPKIKQQTPNNRKRKQFAKQEKKARRMEERRQEIKDKKSECRHKEVEEQRQATNTTMSDFLDLEALTI